MLTNPSRELVSRRTSKKPKTEVGRVQRLGAKRLGTRDGDKRARERRETSERQREERETESERWLDIPESTSSS
jgi:hypothetical protein